MLPASSQPRPGLRHIIISSQPLSISKATLQSRLLPVSKDAVPSLSSSLACASLSHWQFTAHGAAARSPALSRPHPSTPLPPKSETDNDLHGCLCSFWKCGSPISAPSANKNGLIGVQKLGKDKNASSIAFLLSSETSRPLKKLFLAL